MILLLSLILFILLILVGKSRGFKTFMIFYLNLFLIIVYLFLIGIGLNAITQAIIICVLVTLTTLFGLNGINVKTKSSFKSIMIILVIMTGIIFLTCYKANLQGFSAEDIESIGGYSFDINYNMNKILIGMFLITVIGTIIDTSISISSALNEVLINNPNISKNELFKSGMNIGKDILSTTINTLFFALVAEFIGFFMWHYGSSFSYLLNYKAFVSEVSKLLLCFISSILIIPITSYIASKDLIKNKDINY